MNKTLLTTLAVLCVPAVLSAQERPADFHRQELEVLAQPYSLTNNAAGMGLSQPSSGSRTQINLFEQAGDYHLAQQGDGVLGFTFGTERYDAFSDKLFMRGSFSYTLEREKNRAWSDVMDPWSSIPYIYGSAVAKDYDSHDCSLAFDLYTAPLGGLISLGVKTDYRVADISGKRDPRPRTGFLDWQVVPSALLSFGKHHIGLDLGYGHEKEKLSGLTTIQSYPNLYYYKMTGLEHVDGAISAYTGFKRQFSGSRLLGDLSYHYADGGLKVLSSAGLSWKKLTAYGDNLSSPGSYNVWTYSFLADVTLKAGSLLHSGRVQLTYADGGADEYLQERVSEKDPVTGATTESWVTLYTYENRYMLKKTALEASYKLYGGCTGTDYRYNAGIRVGWDAFRKDYYLPHSSFDVGALSVSLDGSLRLFQRKGHKMDFLAAAGFRKNLSAALTLQEDNLYAREVLQKDRDYYACNVVNASGALVWEFPLNLGKAGLASGYVRLDGGLVKALPDGQLSRVELTIGLFTF